MSLVNQPPPLRARPWVCVLLNQLAFPGLGTILAGRRIGYVQATIMVAGFILFTGFMIWFIVCAVQNLLSDTMDETALTRLYRPYLWAAKYGLALCIVAWFWSLISSIGILRQSRKT